MGSGDRPTPPGSRLGRSPAGRAWRLAALVGAIAVVGTVCAPGAFAAGSRAAAAARPRIELYVGAPSVLPGEPLLVKVSTTATRYTLRVFREATDSAGGHTEIGAARVDRRPGVTQARPVVDEANTARAGWRTTDTIPTIGWAPGIYTVAALDSAHTRGEAIVVVRTPVIDRSTPLYVVPAMTYQAYNMWGGASMYVSHSGIRTWRVSFDRPYHAGVGAWRSTREHKLVGWLATNLPGLQYTTDYDLTVERPPVPPRLVILGPHTEYVTPELRWWLDEQVILRGRTSLVNLGANTSYWQVRLEPPTSGVPTVREVTCYRNDGLAGYPRDPVVGPTRTSLFRSASVGRPEGALLGAQFTAVLGDGKTRYPMSVSASAPNALLAGTGWGGSTVIEGLLTGEGDALYPDPDVPVLEVLSGIAIDRERGTTILASSVAKSYPSGARVFNASTFGWPDALEPALIPTGVPDGSFGRFTLNILAWAAAGPAADHPPVASPAQ
jgi:hypothetical protein